MGVGAFPGSVSARKLKSVPGLQGPRTVGAIVEGSYRISTSEISPTFCSAIVSDYGHSKGRTETGIFSTILKIRVGRVLPLFGQPSLIISFPGKKAAKSKPRHDLITV